MQWTKREKLRIYRGIYPLYVEELEVWRGTCEESVSSVCIRRWLRSYHVFLCDKLSKRNRSGSGVFRYSTQFLEDSITSQLQVLLIDMAGAYVCYVYIMSIWESLELSDSESSMYSNHGMTLVDEEWDIQLVYACRCVALLGGTCSSGMRYL